MEFEETTIKSEKIYQGKILNLRCDTVELPGKKYSKRELVEVSPAAAVVPVTQDGNVILVKQFRKPFERVLLEVPAGKLDPGEEPREAAFRELEEETGKRAGKLVYLNEIFTSPGYINEKIHLFLATELEDGEYKPDDDEIMEVVLYNFDELKKMITRGELSDAKSIIAITMAIDYLKEKNLLKGEKK